MEAKKYLVTGGSGFFGSALVRRMAGKGEVAVLDLVDAPDRPEAAAFVRADIRDAEAVARACRGKDVVFHCVAMVPLTKDARAFWSVNRDGTRVLLEAAREAHAGKVVHLSSSAVYGAPAENPVSEDSAPAPQEEYGRAKLAAEKLCREYRDKGLDVTIIRPRTIMGPGRLSIMQIIFEWVRQGRNLPVLGKGDNLYQFVHADDLADACIAAAQKKGPAEYNVGAEKFATMRATLEGLIAHARSKSRVVSLPMAPMTALMKASHALGLSPLGPYHSLMYGRSLYFDVSRARQELDFRPRYSNVEMFNESYDWYVANREKVLQEKSASPHRAAVRQGVLGVMSRMLNLWP
jgi:nucleoside-diphosphate-sugar epimerase